MQIPQDGTKHIYVDGFEVSIAGSGAWQWYPLTDRVDTVVRGFEILRARNDHDAAGFCLRAQNDSAGEPLYLQCTRAA